MGQFCKKSIIFFCPIFNLYIEMRRTTYKGNIPQEMNLSTSYSSSLRLETEHPVLRNDANEVDERRTGERGDTEDPFGLFDLSTTRINSFRMKYNTVHIVYIRLRGSSHHNTTCKKGFLKRIHSRSPVLPHFSVESSYIRFIDLVDLLDSH